MTFKSEISQVNPINGNETKSDIFAWDIFKSDIIFHCRKILKHFNNFYNWCLSITLQN